MKKVEVDSDPSGFRSNASEFQSAESRVECDEVQVGLKQARVELTLVGVRSIMFLVRPNLCLGGLKPCGFALKFVGGDSAAVGIQSTDARFSSRARR